MAQLAEVLLPQPVEGGAVELRRAADEVVDLRLKGCAVRVVPRLGRHVAVLHEHVLREPVLGLTWEPVAAFEQEDPLARRSQMPCERPAACTGADDDHVVVVHLLSTPIVVR